MPSDRHLRHLAPTLHQHLTLWQTSSHATHPVNIEDEMKRSYMDYAMSVIIGRALPDARDGLKPAHRRVLYGMKTMGLASTRGYRKCAKIVGEVMGNFHPHGDASIYDTLVRLAQDFNMRYPLVDGQGNFGSIDGDPPAAMRYTEARLQALADDMMADLDKETVDFAPNYDETTEEPTVLPAPFPNLLVNGSAGIAVGMATNVAAAQPARGDRRLRLADREHALARTPATGRRPTRAEKMQEPDSPDSRPRLPDRRLHRRPRRHRPGVHDRPRLDSDARASRRSRRTRKATARSIVVTEIPYQVNKAKLIERIADLVREKTIEGISDLRDESDRDGMRIVIELKRGEVPEVVLNNLYKHTPLQIELRHHHARHRRRPAEGDELLELVESFIEFRRDVVRRRTEFELRKAEARYHILEGLKIALDHLDEVITLIRGSKTVPEARDGLMTQLRAVADPGAGDPRHAAAAADRPGAPEDPRRARRAAEDDRAAARDSGQRAAADADHRRRAEGRCASKYGDDRRTEIIEGESGEISIEDLIAEEDMAITVSNTGYIKRTAISTYRNQRRGGKGRIGMRTRDEDFVSHLFVASTHAYIMIFSDRGRRLLAEGPRDSRRRARRQRQVDRQPRVDGGRRAHRRDARRQGVRGDKFVVMGTRRGVVKKTALSAFSNPRAGGIIAMGVEEGDAVIAVQVTDGTGEIFIGTRERHGDPLRGRATSGRWAATAYGVRGITLRDDDYVVAMEVVRPGGTLLTVTERGYGKRTEIDEYRVQSRGGVGVINIATTRAERRGRRRRLRPGRRRAAADHPAGHDSPDADQRRPRDRPRDAGRHG